MIGRKLTVWMAGHPMAAVLVILGFLGAVAAAIAVSLPSPGPRESSADASQYRVATEPLPASTGHATPGRVKEVAEAVQTVNRTCNTETRDPPGPGRLTLRGAIDRIGSFADQYPDAGFDIADQRTSSLAMLIVVRQELAECEPSLLPEIESRIPAAYQGD